MTPSNVGQMPGLDAPPSRMQQQTPEAHDPFAVVPGLNGADQEGPSMGPSTEQQQSAQLKAERTQELEERQLVRKHEQGPVPQQGQQGGDRTDWGPATRARAAEGYAGLGMGAPTQSRL